MLKSLGLSNEQFVKFFGEKGKLFKTVQYELQF